MDEQEKYKEYQKGKEQSEATGINAIMRDVEITREYAERDVKNTGDKIVDNVDNDVTEVVEKTAKDVGNTAKDVKNNVKHDLGIGNAKASRFDEGASLADNNKEPEKEDDMYVSRKRARYQ